MSAKIFLDLDHLTAGLGSSTRSDDRTPRSRRDSILSDLTVTGPDSQGQQARLRGDSPRDFNRRAPLQTGGYQGYIDDQSRGQASHSYTYQPYDSRRGGSKIYHTRQGYGSEGYTPSIESVAGTLSSTFSKLDISDRDSILSSTPKQTFAPPNLVDRADTPKALSAIASPRSSSPPRNIRGTPGNKEKIDNSYVVRKDDYKKFFRVGRVFATLWTDPIGDSGKIDPTFVSPVLYGEKVFTKIRRFVVARQGDRAVSCLPVTSYNGDGINKKGIRLNEHGFIYSRPSPPAPYPGMLPESLKIVLSKAQHLSDPSLVNYGKVYNVETNVKVKDVGDLDSESRGILGRYFKQIMSDDTGQASEASRSREALAGIGGVAMQYPGPSPGLPSPMNDYPSQSKYSTGNMYNNMSNPPYPGQGYLNPSFQASTQPSYQPSPLSTTGYRNEFRYDPPSSNASSSHYDTLSICSSGTSYNSNYTTTSDSNASSYYTPNQVQPYRNPDFNPPPGGNYYDPSRRPVSESYAPGGAIEPHPSDPFYGVAASSYASSSLTSVAGGDEDIELDSVSATRGGHRKVRREGRRHEERRCYR